MTHKDTSTHSSDEATGIPRHIAIIMDGNGRWARQRFLPRFAGHLKGVEAVRSIIEACLYQGIEYLTLFAFSSENWRRPATEISLLMKLFATALKREVTNMDEQGIRLKVVGDLGRFAPSLQEIIAESENKTAANSRLTLTVCANYGGRWDMLQACSRMIKLHPGMETFTEEQLAPHLIMAYAPEPDLFIRTGGEQRISNFLLWQLAYTELYFTPTYWPDFDAQALQSALDSFRQRERRFGRTSDQISLQKRKS